MIAPADLRELAAALRDTPGALRLQGAGTGLERGREPERVDAVVDLRRMGVLVEHSPGDMIAVVQPGLPLRDLQAALAGSGQRLALDPPEEAEGATLGGLYAADAAGPLRQRYGTLRDLAIGVTGVLADGTVFRAGGRVVKNVAGFDLVRLLCGSLGTLAAVGELVVRLHPLPEAAAIVRIPADGAAATRLTLALMAAPLEPVAIEWCADPGVLLVRLEGRPAGVAAQAEAVLALAGGGETLAGADADAAWAEVARGHRGQPGETVAHATVPPARVGEAADALAREAATAGVEATVTASTGVGVLDARLRGGDAAAHAAVVRVWRRSAQALGGAVVLHRRAEGVEAHVDPWYDSPDQAPSAVATMRAVKANLDPERRLAPGTFVGGI